MGIINVMFVSESLR